MNDLSTRPAWALPEVNLNGKTVLVIGGTGGVGEGVVQTLLSTGATVVAAGRSRARLDDLRLRSESARLATETVDALDPALAGRAAELAGRHGAFDGVVVSVASWGHQGRKAALSLSDDEWNGLVASNLTAVFRLYRAFVPHMALGGALVQLNGMSADLPFPGGAGVASSAAARKSLTRTIAAELSGRGPRVYGVILGMVRTRPRRLAGIDDPQWIPASDVGWHIAELVAGTSPLAPDDLHYFVDAAAGPRSGTGR